MIIWAGLLLAAFHWGTVSQVCFRTECFRVELAVTEAAQRHGLMNRPSLEPDAGMLFIYPKEAFPVMYMKNTRFPIDMIWLNQKKEVVHIQPQAAVCPAEPCPRYYTVEPAMYVLELNAGAAERLNLKPGDLARFS